MNGGPLQGLSGRLGALLAVVALLGAGASSALAAGPSNGLAPAFTSTSAPSATVSALPPAPVVPPDLIALEQKMLAMEVTSERFSASISVAGDTQGIKGPLGGFARVVSGAAGVPFPVLSVSGEQGFTPPLAKFQASLLGLIKVEGRLIGTTLYTDEPFLARLDGGRPWVEEPNQHLEQALGVGPASPAASTTGGATKAFGTVLEQIAHARAIRELGVETVDGVPTTVFSLSIAPGQFATLTETQRRTYARLLKPLADFDLYITAGGLPVRSKITLELRSSPVQLISQADILAVNVPVSIQAPPASQTISKAALERMLAVVRRHGHSHRKKSGKSK